MNPQRQLVSECFASAISRLEPTLTQWGFVFESDGIHASHNGPFASGHFLRGETKIGLSCRETIDNLYYEHTFITRNTYSTEYERFTIGHKTLMRSLGHSDECCLIQSDCIPDMIVARNGNDRVDALIDDLTNYAITVLREPCDEFFGIVREGYRCYSVA